MYHRTDTLVTGLNNVRYDPISQCGKKTHYHLTTNMIMQYSSPISTVNYIFRVVYIEIKHVICIFSHLIYLFVSKFGWVGFRPSTKGYSIIKV